MTIKFKREPEPGLHCREDDYYYKLYNDEVSVSWVTLSEHEFNKLFYEMAKELGYKYVDKSKGILYSGGDIPEITEEETEERNTDDIQVQAGLCYKRQCDEKRLGASKYCEKHTADSQQLKDEMITLKLNNAEFISKVKLKEDSPLREQIKRDCEEYDKLPEWLKVSKKKEDDEEDKDLGICYEIGCRNKYIQDSKYCEKHTIKHHINNNLIKSEQEHKLQLQINKLLERLNQLEVSNNDKTEIINQLSKRIKECEDSLSIEIQSIKTNLNNIYNELGVGKEDRIMDKEEIKKY